MDNYPISGVYLMGRLRGKEGEVCRGAKFFPLPYETMVIPGSVWLEEQSYSADNKATTTVKSEHPLGYSDKHGKINFFGQQPQEGKEFSLAGVPAAVDSVGKRQVLFFPSYLVPMHQISFEGKWLSNLHEKLKVIEKDKYFTNQEVSLDLAVPENKQQLMQLPNGTKAKELGEYFENYESWFDSLGKQKIHILEVPQYYTIVVSFSSEKYIGATVTLSELPTNIVVMGSEGTNKAKVSRSIFNDVDKDATEQDHYCATFWIETDVVPSLHEFEQYCRIDVDASTLSDEDFSREMKEQGLVTYSLKEKVFHLPIKTVAGRCSVVNGDPISAEEALFNHVPEYFQHVVDQINKQPTDLPQSIALNSDMDKPLSADLWHHLQTYKGFYEAGTMALENGLTWQMLAKLTTAGLSKALEGGESDLAKATLAAVGVTGAAMTFLGAVQNLKAPNNVSNVAISTPLKRFFTGAGKVGSFILDKPLTTVESIYNISKAFDTAKDAEKKEATFVSKVGDYSSITISPSEGKLVEFDTDAKALQEKEEKVVKALFEALKNKEGLDRAGDSHSDSDDLGDEIIRLNSTVFSFDKASFNPEKNIAKHIEAIGKELAELSDPIDVVVSGHTCFIGKEDYNLGLSVRRANKVKEHLLVGVGEENRATWEPRIKAMGYGESKPIADNNDEAERFKNRRVDILLKFSSQFDYPPCRSGLMVLEKARKEFIAKQMDLDTDVVNAVSTSLDLVLGLASKIPGVNIAAVVITGARLLVTAAEAYHQVSEPDKYKLLESLRKLHHSDTTISIALLRDGSLTKHHGTLLKGYMKRALALNGLMRLIQKFQYEEKRGPVEVIGDYGLKEMRPPMSFKSFDFHGYINTFLLSDDWDFESSYFGPMHLDEFWLESKKMSVSTSLPQVTPSGVLAQGRYIYANLTQNDAGEESLNQAQKYHKYFPIHYAASNTVNSFKKLIVSKVPDGLDESIFSHVIMSAHSPEESKWKPFIDYYAVEKHSRLSPYDHIRILVILNTESDALKKIEKDLLSLFPIGARAVSRADIKDWRFFDKEVSESVEYASLLDESDLVDHEKEVLKKELKEGKLIGAIINPSFFFGTHQIMGTRPSANYKSLEPLFGEKKNKTSGGSKYLSYFYEVFVPGQPKTEKKIAVRNTKSMFVDPNFFNLTLSPSREYTFKSDSKFQPPAIKADKLFYEKSFLEAKNPAKEVTYPGIFDSPKVDFYLGQRNIKVLGAEKDDKKVIINKRFVNEDIASFDWNASVLARLIVRTKAKGTENLKHQNYDANVVPIKSVLNLSQVMSDKHIELSELNRLYRVGQIQEKDKEFIFVPTPYTDEEMSKSVKAVRKDFERLSSQQLEKLAIDEGIFDKRVTTDIFAHQSYLKYVNALGAEVHGIPPLLTPNEVSIPFCTYAQFKVVLNGPKGSGLKGEPSDEYRIYDQPASTPSNWYKTKGRDAVQHAKLQLDTNNKELSDDAKSMAFKDNTKDGGVSTHQMSEHMKWIKEGNAPDSKELDLTTLTKGRIEMLNNWLDL